MGKGLKEVRELVILMSGGRSFQAEGMLSEKAVSQEHTAMFEKV